MKDHAKDEWHTPVLHIYAEAMAIDPFLRSALTHQRTLRDVIINTITLCMYDE